MAMENLRSIKRKRGSMKPKLDVNERVEVRGMEEGFLGSWHPGTVIQCGELKRHVRYENILDDNGVNYLVDEVIVSKAWDGDSDSSNCNMRGSIRPLPPLIEFEECELKFGLCVDVNHQEAWWEGVIFDRCDGKEERSVFFPDLGDEMKIGIHQMRITHDWDEVTGKWRRRGNWVFLELFEECERTSFVAVSAKQVWYDVRVKRDFNRIRDWTFNVKEFWRDLVMEVVSDYLTLTVREICSSLDLPRSLLTETPKLETVEPMANGNFNHQENASMRVLIPPPKAPGTRVAFRPPPIRSSCPRPTAVRSPLRRPTTATRTPILHAPVPPRPLTPTTPTVIQPPSVRSSPPPNEPITTETIETASPASTSRFLRSMRFMPTPGFKATRKMD